jgi:hypothetical protein
MLTGTVFERQRGAPLRLEPVTAEIRLFGDAAKPRPPSLTTVVPAVTLGAPLAPNHFKTYARHH